MSGKLGIKASITERVVKARMSGTGCQPYWKPGPLDGKEVVGTYLMPSGSSLEGKLKWPARRRLPKRSLVYLTCGPTRHVHTTYRKHESRSVRKKAPYETWRSQPVQRLVCCYTREEKHEWVNEDRLGSQIELVFKSATCIGMPF